jgi:hypothetical protein
MPEPKPTEARLGSATAASMVLFREVERVEDGLRQNALTMLGKLSGGLTRENGADVFERVYICMPSRFRDVL